MRCTPLAVGLPAHTANLAARHQPAPRGARVMTLSNLEKAVARVLGAKGEGRDKKKSAGDDDDSGGGGGDRAEGHTLHSSPSSLMPVAASCVASSSAAFASAAAASSPLKHVE